MAYKAQRIRDPLHNIVEFKATEFEDVLWRITNTRPFQRLRRVKQLGFSDFVYPGATHSRFIHSIGVFHTARILMDVINRELGGQKKPMREQLALAAALVHDVGHGAFSHAFEDVGQKLGLQMADHEVVSDLLIRDSEISEVLSDIGSGFANDVADIIKKGPSDIYSAVVSSQFDADRLDYIRRDRLMSGTNHGAIDFEWLLANLKIETIPYGVDNSPLQSIETFCLGPKALFAAEAYVLGLFQLYPTLYLHKTTRGAEKLFSELLLHVFEAAANGKGYKTGLPQNHPLLKFAVGTTDYKQVLDLDDSVIWGSLSLFAESDIPAISEAARRLKDRRLYKAIDIRQSLSVSFDDTKEGRVELDERCSEIEQKIREKNDLWKVHSPDKLKRILVDKTKRDPYKPMTESKGPLNQIRIKTSDNGAEDLGAVSKVVNAIRPFEVLRAYHSPDDHEAREFLISILKEK
ncbi:HD domain-containing protein [Agrobacterium rosae]|uniref:HD domain-containing protein n=1 Tax=Agrobacterium rosae TaxID=1972867 RepID=UPI0019D37477|nr:HD domain-containing protein [Agrobacterium rosae]MBN7804831.1 HD domain-containing protein [Agrobacterium rosae]